MRAPAAKQPAAPNHRKGQAPVSPAVLSSDTLPPCPLLRELQARVVGQTGAIEAIVPYVQMFEAGLNPPGRPLGVFLLLGPTGTGKTRTVEALAEVLHGSARNLVRIDCGEFQMEHEVAKLIGAPPGYLGHRETHPLLTQQKLNAATSEHSQISIVLFDEIEKAAPSLTRLLLGVLDKATLRLGDNTSVNFERTLIFLTSNLGARSMLRALRPDFGFEAAGQRAATAEGDTSHCPAGRLEKIGLSALRKRFSPEFVNRIDAAVTYRPLGRDELSYIIDLNMDELEQHIELRLGARSFEVDLEESAREFLLDRGTSVEYGARELKRTMHRYLTQPLAAMVAGGMVAPRSVVRVERDARGAGLRLVCEAA